MKLDLLIPGAPAIDVAGITADSRKVKPGFVFAALQGVAKDGRAYIDGAIKAGAVAILTDEASELAANQWEIYRAYQDSIPKQGSVKFGICCATNIEITLEGKIETLNTGYDWIRVYHNGVEVFSHESTDTSDDPDDAVAVGPFVVSLPLEDRPCGHIIEITGSTGDGIANNDVFWQASVIIS